MMGETLAPGLAAIPSDLRMLQGGLAVMFSVSGVFEIFLLDLQLTLDDIACETAVAGATEDPFGLSGDS